MQVNLNTPGGYTFALSYLGDEKYNGTFGVAKITVVKNNATLTVKTSGKKATLTLALGNGTKVSGQKISFTVKGKTYTATTNANGVATVTVSISAKGTYAYTASFAGNTQINKVTKTGSMKIS